MQKYRDKPRETNLSFFSRLYTCSPMARTDGNDWKPLWYPSPGSTSPFEEAEVGHDGRKKRGAVVAL